MKTLRYLFSSQSWYYSFGSSPEIDFCFWVLERDGLRVPPFGRHPEGDGSLRAAGLDATSWWTWLERSIAAYEKRSELLKAMAKQKVDVQSLRDLRTVAQWNGAPPVGSQLMELAEEYEEISNERAASKGEIANILAQCDAQLWKDLAPFRRRLPPVEIFTVAYPRPVQTVMPPATILLATGHWQPTPSNLAAAILEGMHTLARPAQP